MRQILRSIISFIFFLILAVPAYFVWSIYKPLPIQNNYILYVKPNASLKSIANTLNTDNLIQNTLTFEILARLYLSETTIKMGEYIIKPGMSLNNLVEQLKSGKVIQHAFIIKEGWNFARLLSALNEADYLEHTINSLNETELMEKLDQKGIPAEGQFFPETYFFPKGTTDLAVLKRANQLLQLKLKNIWDNRDPKIILKTPYEALILASIIEKESGVYDEYPEIAGVFVRRLERNMPLQADPTVIYGMNGEYTGVITSDDLKKPTPYNTYIINGLPPTPIGFPGLKALFAATHPKVGETLYFVAIGDKSRGHYFSKTLEEHNLAVKRYKINKASSE